MNKTNSFFFSPFILSLLHVNDMIPNTKWSRGMIFTSIIMLEINNKINEAHYIASRWNINPFFAL